MLCHDKTNEFMCYHCKETFEIIAAWNAEKEFDELFSKDNLQQAKEEREILCDDCFKKFCVWALEHPIFFVTEQLNYFKEYIEENHND